jgi:hypothetical protein
VPAEIDLSHPGPGLCALWIYHADAGHALMDINYSFPASSLIVRWFSRGGMGQAANSVMALHNIPGKVPAADVGWLTRAVITQVQLLDCFIFVKEFYILLNFQVDQGIF